MLGRVPVRLSFTKLDLYEFCPFAYQYRYVERIPVPFAARLVVGAIVHAVLKSFFERLRDGLRAGSAELRALHAAYWDNAPRLTPETHPDIWQAGRDLLEGFWTANCDDLGRPVLLEARFRTRFDAADAHTVEGVIDRVDAGDEGTEIIDYKSGAAPTQLTQRHRTQLHTYALAVEREFGLRPQRLTAYFLRDNRAISIPPDDAFATRVAARFRQAAGRIEAEVYDPTPGPHCAHCDYKDRCPYRWREPLGAGRRT
jgi:putative RecB family exonuclease